MSSHLRGALMSSHLGSTFVSICGSTCVFTSGALVSLHLQSTYVFTFWGHLRLHLWVVPLSSHLGAPVSLHLRGAPVPSPLGATHVFTSEMVTYVFTSGDLCLHIWRDTCVFTSGGTPVSSHLEGHLCLNI